MAATAADDILGAAFRGDYRLGLDSAVSGDPPEENEEEALGSDDDADGDGLRGVDSPSPSPSLEEDEDGDLFQFKKCN